MNNLRRRNVMTLSIVIPSYNCVNTIRDCIDSIGDVEGIQIVIVDDASTDATLSVLYYLQQDYKHLDIVISSNKSNLGPGLTRNIGIDLASNEYVMFVDSDDRLEVSACETILRLLDEWQPDVLFFDALIERNHKMHKLKMFISPDIKGGKVLNRDAFVYGRGCTWGKVYRRSLIKDNDIKFLDLYRGEDIPFAKHAFASAESIYYYSAPLYIYCENFDSLMHNLETLSPINPSIEFNEIYNNIEADKFSSELDCLYYVLTVYPVIITMMRKGFTSHQCSVKWRELTKGKHIIGEYFKRLELKYKIAYLIFRSNMFWLVRWLLRHE